MKTVLSGCFLSFDQSINNVVYTKDSFVNSIDAYKNLVNTHGSYGELAITTNACLCCNSLHISNISHVVKYIELNESGIYGTLKILNTTSGSTIKELLLNNVMICITPRFIGTTDPITKLTTVEKIISFDVTLRGNNYLKIEANNRYKLKK
jgi:hypothetical protein